MSSRTTVAEQWSDVFFFDSQYFICDYGDIYGHTRDAPDPISQPSLYKILLFTYTTLRVYAPSPLKIRVLVPAQAPVVSESKRIAPPTLGQDYTIICGCFEGQRRRGIGGWEEGTQHFLPEVDASDRPIPWILVPQFN